MGVWSFSLLLTIVAGLAPKGSARPAPEWEAVLHNRQGWIGSDCAYSVDLGRERILWLFDDTFCGVIEQGRRVQATMEGIRNSVAIMRGRRAPTASVTFFVRKDQDGKPCSFFTPPDGSGWFWFGDGLLVQDRLFLFLWQMISDPKPGTPEVFHFTLKGSSLAVISNPGDDPDRWMPTFHPIPFGSAGEVFWGGAVVRVGEWVYIYGLRVQESGKGRGLVVARVPANRMADFSHWRFYSSDGWSETLDRALVLVEDCQPELSVCYLPDKRVFLMVYSPSDLRSVILLRRAPSPVGPWSDPVVIYQCPEPARNSRVFCYAAKAHPEISEPGELVVTYATNSFRFQDLLDDASLYFPRFLRLFLTADR
ncbi:MAG: DUF4185 domain-containing protein [Armatimonadetes bacterium]|nr:DUF4185 domain-containing protein [Armatimonadota bacterium]MDW8121373.1 DUF4185 domain-containing protein [Armatimonadota bacterium]